MTLLEELERATEGSRGVDARIAKAIGIRVVKDGDEFYDWPARSNEGEDAGPRGFIKDYTTSLDAALTLVPEGWQVYRLGQSASPNYSRWYAELTTIFPEIAPTSTWKRSSAPTPALALCIASLRAIERAKERVKKSETIK